jgi:hypothetical protein
MSDCTIFRAAPTPPGDASTWTAGEIRLACETTDCRVAGWVTDLFGLDYRPVATANATALGAWVLTHLPTGHSVLAISGDFATAALVVAAVEAWGDWHFSDPREIVDRFTGRLDPLRERFSGGVVISPAFAPVTDRMVAPGALMRSMLRRAHPEISG